MSYLELQALTRAHELFGGSGPAAGLDANTAQFHDASNPAVAQHHYERAATRAQAALTSSAQTDAAATAVLAGAHRDRAAARELTGAVLGEARADAATTPLTPLAQREAMRRRVARLRAQRAHVAAARSRSRRHAAALRALRYRMTHHGGGRRLPLPSGRAGLAVRAALSRLGRPYVWGATGPDQFDCSGLVQWAYAQAGVHLDRTTYQQINDGVPVPRSQVRPGDLVFPHAGHVQLAIGNNLVVEAPYSGASVRISPLGGNVQIRRPL
ncbi:MULTISPECIES: C40 family peptidase [Mycobacterium]|uniref:NLP/P60 family protein n=1 Tax=Mycobacterium kiyosense TaxID=2871094 RepID=A0A9P3QB69_9MYCO|nr:MULTISPECIES: C40 family peptidase [Mycobacterium]BDB39591.1 NLP/P60 family protein [Mycobacterium kiyosense]BDE11455.1 NLP/P60 family protein [Mycobacterium sp. 20KCMC460]GLB83443.1 NLP/P60 family protein [Mycobacterium kiyosense]GLB88834.1 NLP/P60 family protein [Mycobacterium kiyosense]GLB97098.1 NLP/P60 family protein [Mycobacterium kiyosense]